MRTCRGSVRRCPSADGRSIWGFLLFGIEAIRHSKTVPYVVINGQPTIPTWTAPLALVVVTAVLMPGSSALGHLSGLAVGYACTLSVRPFLVRQTLTAAVGLEYIKFLAPPEWALRWIEGKLKLRTWLPYYVGVDQKAPGRFNVLPLTNLGTAPAAAPGFMGTVQRLGSAPE